MKHIHRKQDKRIRKIKSQISRGVFKGRSKFIKKVNIA